MANYYDAIRWKGCGEKFANPDDGFHRANAHELTVIFPGITPPARIYLTGPAPTGDWAAEIRTWLPAGTLIFSASQANGWLEIHAERLDAVLESAA